MVNSRIEWYPSKQKKFLVISILKKEYEKYDLRFLCRFHYNVTGNYVS